MLELDLRLNGSEYFYRHIDILFILDLDLMLGEWKWVSRWVVDLIWKWLQRASRTCKASPISWCLAWLRRQLQDFPEPWMHQINKSRNQTSWDCICPVNCGQSTKKIAYNVGYDHPTIRDSQQKNMYPPASFNTNMGKKHGWPFGKWSTMIHTSGLKNYPS